MKQEKDCHSCGSELSSFDHCGICGETRKIPKMKKKGKLEFHLDSVLDEFERPKNNTKTNAFLFAILLSVVASGCLVAFLILMKGVMR